jgi:hypothetical protein
MSAIIKVHISACPQCGTNEWLMEVPDEIARKPGVQRGEQTPSRLFGGECGSGSRFLVGRRGLR